MTADPIGGVWTYALELARALALRGVHVALATMGAPLRDDQRRDARAVPGLALYESTRRLEWMDDAWVDVDCDGEWLSRLADELQPDLVHLNGYAHAALRWPAPVVVVAHSCVCSWWRAVLRAEAPGAWDEYRRRVAAGLRAAEAVVAPTRAMLDALIACYDVDIDAKAHVISNGVAPLQTAEDDRKEPVILGVGRLWDDGKNLALLAKAAPELPWPVYVAGDATPPGGVNGPRFSADHITALGRLAARDVETWMQRASIYVLPARYEPFGLSALEAARAGCALVLGEIATLREVWDDAAIYVDTEDAMALARAIGALAGDDRYRRRMAERARRRAARYTADTMAARYVALYGSLADRVTTRQEETACVS